MNQKCASPTSQCQCKNGFIPNVLGDCRDIDECETDTHSCSNSSVCVNRQGTYDCLETSTETTEFPTSSIKTSTARKAQTTTASTTTTLTTPT